MANPFRSGRSGRLSSSDLRAKRRFGFSQRIAKRFFGGLPNLSTLTENWNDNTWDFTKWYNSNPTYVVEQNQRLEISTDLFVKYDFAISEKKFNFYDSSVSVKLTNAGNQSLTSLEVYPIEVMSNFYANKVTWLVTNNTIRAYRVIGGVATQIGSSIAYNSSTHLFFRIREQNGITYWDTSADGIAWTNRFSLTNPFSYTDTQLILEVGTWNAEASATTAFFEDINILPTAPNYTLTADPVTFTIAAQAANIKRQFLLIGAVATYTIIAQAANLNFVRHLVATLGTYAITTTGANLTVARKLTAQVSSYSISTVPAILRAVRRLVATVGTYTIASQSALLAYSRVLRATLGTFTISTVAAILRANRRLPMVAASYTIDTPPIQVVVVYRLYGQSTAFAVAGTNTRLLYRRIMPIAVASFAITANAAGLARRLRITAAVASYSLATSSTALRLVRRLPAVPGAYTISGSDTGLRTARKLTAVPATYTIDGQSASIRYDRKLGVDLGTYVLSPYPAFLFIDTGFEDPFSPGNEFTTPMVSPFSARGPFLTPQAEVFTPRPNITTRPPTTY